MFFPPPVLNQLVHMQFTFLFPVLAHVLYLCASVRFDGVDFFAFAVFEHDRAKVRRDDATEGVPAPFVPVAAAG